MQCSDCHAAVPALHHPLSSSFRPPVTAMSNCHAAVLALVLQLSAAIPRPVTDPGTMGVLRLQLCHCSCGVAPTVVEWHLLLLLSLLWPGLSERRVRGLLMARTARGARGWRVCRAQCVACRCTPHGCRPLVWWLVVLLWGARRMPSVPVGAGSALDAHQLLGPSYPPCYHGAAHHKFWDRLQRRVPLVECTWLPFGE